MPYRRYKKRTYRKRRRNIFWRRGKNKALYMAKKALSMLNVEYKNHDVTLTNVTVPDTVGVIQQLTLINQGDTTNTRDGAQIKLTSFQIKGQCQLHTSATSSVVRLMLILDKQTNQAIYTTADLLSNVTTVDSINAPLNLDNKHRFVVLWDKTLTMSEIGNEVRQFKYYRKLSLKLRFDASTGAIADLTSYSLSLVRISNETTNLPNYSAIIRLRYVDN